MIQFAQQGYTEIEFEDYDTDWNSEAYLTVSGQNSNNSVRVTNAFMRGRRKRRRLASRPAHRTARSTEDAAGARAVGPDRLCRLGVRRSRRAVRHHHQRMAHLPRGRADQRVQPVLGIHVPRRHGLQPGLAQPDELPPPRTAASTSRPSSMPCGCGPSCLEISVLMAQFPSRADRPAILRLPHPRPRLCQHRRAC